MGNDVVKYGCTNCKGGSELLERVAGDFKWLWMKVARPTVSTVHCSCSALQLSMNAPTFLLILSFVGMSTS